MARILIASCNALSHAVLAVCEIVRLSLEESGPWSVAIAVSYLLLGVVHAVVLWGALSRSEELVE